MGFKGHGPDPNVKARFIMATANIGTASPKGSMISVVVTGKLPETPLEVINQYLDVLKANQQRWAQDYPITRRIAMLGEIINNIFRYKDDWIRDDLKARNIEENHWDQGSSAIGGPALAAHIAHVFLDVLKDLEKHGGTKPFAKAKQDGDRVVVKSFPRNFKDGLLLPGFKGEIHLEKGTKLDDLASLQAAAYKDKSYSGGVSLVLGAGNVSFLTLNDAFHKLFVEKKVVIIKANPVLEYIGPLLEKIFEPLIREGFVRIVTGGSREGIHLSHHPFVDDIHITGSDKSFEAIVYGPGEEGRMNKTLDNRVNPRTVTGELGNVTPVIVIPGDWKERDYEYQAKNIFSMLHAFNGYACVAMRVLILPKHWEGAHILLEKIEKLLSKTRQPANYYPGTNDTVAEELACYPNAERYGKLTPDQQPWVFAKNLDADREEVAFTREFWSSFFSQTYIDGTTKEEYLENAVKFANQKLWGTLAAVIIIDPNTEKVMTENKSLPKAIDDLHYGTVAINVHSAFSSGLGTNPWGGYPGATYNNIQSGNGFVSNAFMLDKIEKSVLHAPFIISPRPMWFASDHPNLKAADALTNFAISNKLMDFARLLYAVVRGK
jgi:hypothetical protein